MARRNTAFCSTSSTATSAWRWPVTTRVKARSKNTVTRFPLPRDDQLRAKDQTAVHKLVLSVRVMGQTRGLKIKRDHAIK